MRCDKNFTFIISDNDDKDNDNEDNDNDNDKYIEEPGNVRYNFQYQHQYYQSSLKISFFLSRAGPTHIFSKEYWVGYMAGVAESQFCPRFQILYEKPVVEMMKIPKLKQ